MSTEKSHSEKVLALHGSYVPVGPTSFGRFANAALNGLLPELESLNIHACISITDIGFSQFAEALKLGKCRKLKCLRICDGPELSDNSFTNVARAAAAGLLPDLLELAIHETPNITWTSVEILADAAITGAIPRLANMSWHGCAAFDGLPQANDVSDERPLETLRQLSELQKAKQGEILAEPLSECRVFLIGESQVGKTSLWHAMHELSTPSSLERTRGFEINKPSVTSDNRGYGPLIRVVDDQEVRIHLWDVGGAHLMHTTCGFWMSHRCIYVLVLDRTRPVTGRSLGFLDKQKEFPDAGNCLDYWLRMVKYFGQRHGSSVAPVILVGSKTDLVDSGDCENLLGEIKISDLRADPQFSDLVLLGDLEHSDQPIFTNLPTTSQVPADSVQVDLRIQLALSNLRDDPETRELREWVFAPKPAYLRRARDVLLERLADGGLLTVQMYREECCTADVLDIPTEKQEFVLRWLHDLRQVLWFREEPSLDDVIFDVDWANQAIYQVIEYVALTGVHRGKLGEFSEQDIGDAIPGISPDRRRRVLALLRVFDTCLIVDPVNGQYVFPALRPPMDKATKGQWRDQWKKSPRCDVGFLPERVVQNVATRLEHLLRDSGAVWRDGLVIQASDGQTIGAIIAEEDSPAVRISVCGKDRKACENLHYMIGETLDAVLDPRGQADRLSIDNISREYKRYDSRQGPVQRWPADIQCVESGVAESRSTKPIQQVREDLIVGETSDEEQLSSCDDERLRLAADLCITCKDTVNADDNELLKSLYQKTANKSPAMMMTYRAVYMFQNVIRHVPGPNKTTIRPELRSIYDWLEKNSDFWSSAPDSNDPWTVFGPPEDKPTRNTFTRLASKLTGSKGEDRGLYQKLNQLGGLRCPPFKEEDKSSRKPKGSDLR